MAAHGSTLDLAERRACALVLNIGVSILSWMRKHYVLNKRIVPVERHNVISLVLLFASGIAWFVSVDSIDAAQMPLQVTSAVFATLLAWLAKTVIVNETYEVRRYQLWALPLEFATEVLRQAQVWLLVDSVVVPVCTGGRSADTRSVAR